MSTNGKTVGIRYYDKNKNYLGSANITNTTFTTQTGAIYFKLLILNTTTYINDVSVNNPATYTEYHAYNGKNINVVFTDSGSPLTVYGGTLDVITGVLTIKYIIVDLSTLTFNYNSGWGCWVNTDGITDAKVASNTAPMNGLCVRFVIVKASGYTSSSTYGTMAMNVSKQLFINNGSSETTPTGQLIYELETPQTYQLTPTQINSLLGVNNIFADTGDILEGQYFIAF